MAIGGSAIVRTSTATVATTTLRPAEKSNPLRVNNIRQEEIAHRIAWAAVKRSYAKDGDRWVLIE